MSPSRFSFQVAAIAALTTGSIFAAPTSAEVLATARQLIAVSRLPETREPLADALAREPENHELRLLLAHVLGRLHRGEEAITLLEPAVDAHPTNAALIEAYGSQLVLRADELGSGFRAILLGRRGRDALERAVELEPRSVSLRESLVTFYRRAPHLAGGDSEKARVHAAALVNIDPVRGHVCVAALDLEAQRYPDAFAACDAALAAAPDDYAALFLLGRTVAASGLRLEDGDSALRRCLGLKPASGEPDRAGIYQTLGVLAEKRGDLVAAIAAYQSALSERPSFTAPAKAIERLRTTRADSLTPPR